MDIYYIDGQFTESEKALVSVNDIAVLRGFGVFDFLITYNRRPFRLKEHVQRFENSAKYIGLELKHSNSEICEIVEVTVRRNPHHTESAIRIVLTGGVSTDSVTPEGQGILMVMVTPKTNLPEWWYTRGAKVITVDIERFIPASKSTCYLSAVYATQKARKEGAIEAVYVDRNKRVLEGTTSNFFCFINNRLVTAGSDILPGITRSVILELAREFCAVEVRDIHESEIGAMEEVFVTASNKEVVPIIEVNDSRIGNGEIGKNTRKIMQLFREYTNAYGAGKIGGESLSTSR
ncbi:MAG: aminotransferase class IV [Syntrophobacteraceae bacterium]